MNAETDSYKVVVLGDSGAGKTSLIFKYVKGTFSPFYGTTIGTSFVVKRVDDRSSLKIWDTAGQERYRSTVPLYCHGASAVLIVFDLMSDRAEESVSEWIKYASDSVEEGVPVFIAGNKCDLVQNEEELAKYTNRKFLDRDVAIVSAKTGKNVNMLFENIANQLIGSNKANTVQNLAQPEMKNLPDDNKCC